jgi:hypothetical protein
MNDSVNTILALVAVSVALATPGAIAAPTAGQSHFGTPLRAVVALAEAVRVQDDAALMTIFGTGAEDILHTEDPIQDRKAFERFSERLDQKIALVRQSDDVVELELGKDDFPFPIPLQRGEKGWYFDTEAGRDEILNRRIGANELHTLGVVRAYVEAQYEYAQQDPDGDGKADYADRLLSSEGKKDGLYWPSVEGQAESPMGPMVAAAAAEGYRKDNQKTGNSYHGYHYKLLTAQGDAAPGGKRSYLKGGELSGGFALVAYPAEYGISGIMTFIINQQGIVFQKDLGEDTPKLAAEIVAYDPGEGWVPTGDAFANAEDEAGE